LPFLPPNQQRQSTEGISVVINDIHKTEQEQVKDKQTDFAAASFTGKDSRMASEIFGKCRLMLGPTAWARRPIARNAALPEDFSRALRALKR